MLSMILICPTSYHLCRVRPSQNKLTSQELNHNQKSCLKGVYDYGPEVSLAKSRDTKVPASVSEVVCMVASLAQLLEQGLLSSVPSLEAASRASIHILVLLGLCGQWPPPDKGSLPSLTPRWLPSDGAEGSSRRVPGRSLRQGDSCWLCRPLPVSARQGVEHGVGGTGAQEHWGCAWAEEWVSASSRSCKKWEGGAYLGKGTERWCAQVGKGLQEQLATSVGLVHLSMLVPSTVLDTLS